LVDNPPRLAGLAGTPFFKREAGGLLKIKNGFQNSKGTRPDNWPCAFLFILLLIQMLIYSNTSATPAAVPVKPVDVALVPAAPPIIWIGLLTMPDPLTEAFQPVPML